MTVKDLIEALQKEDPSRLVVMSRDSEGNGYHQVDSLEECSFADNETGLEVLTDELREQGYSEDDVLHGTPALCIWP